MSPSSRRIFSKKEKKQGLRKKRQTNVSNGGKTAGSVHTSRMGKVSKYGRAIRFAAPPNRNAMKDKG